MDVEIEEEERCDWRDHLSKDEDAEYLPKVVFELQSNRQTSRPATKLSIPCQGLPDSLT